MKHVHIIRTLVGIAALAAIVYFIAPQREMQPVVIYKTTYQNTDQNAPTGSDLSQPLEIENNAQPVNENTVNGNTDNTSVDAQGTIISAEQRLKQAMASPAYHEYSRKQAEQVGFNVVLYWEFLEASGIPHNGRRLQAEAFEKYFPDGGDYTDYEPMMRLAVAELFLEDPDASVMDVLQQFNAERPNRVWRFGYFNGYEGEYEWGQQIQRDAVDIFANGYATPETFQGPPFTGSETDAETAIPATDAAVEASTFEHLTGTDLAEIPTFDAPETMPETLEELRAQFFQQYPTSFPELPSEAQLETTFREQFSPERFNTAMQTLYRHGPEEGIHQLKTADPEVAAYFQRYLHPNAKTD